MGLKCFIRYSARESITLIAAKTPKKRKPTKADLEIDKEVQEILKALPSSRFLAVPTSVTLQPILGVTGNEARGSEDTYLDSSQGVEVPRLVPNESMDPDGQPDEEEIADTPQDLNIANAMKAKAWDALNMLFNGNIWMNENLQERYAYCAEVLILYLQIAVLTTNCANRLHWHSSRQDRR